MFQSNRFGATKENKQATTFILFISAVVLNHALSGIFSGRKTFHDVVVYIAILAGFIVFMAPMYLFKKTTAPKYMFFVLTIISLTSIIMTETGSMSILLACYTTIYGFKNNVMPKNYIVRYFLLLTLSISLMVSVYISAKDVLAAFINGILFYASGTIMFGLEFGFSSKNLSKTIHKLNENELLYVSMMKEEYSQEQIADILEMSVSGVQKLVRSLRTKAGVKTTHGLAIWAKDNGLI